MSETQERQEAHLDTAGLPSPGQMLKRERESQGLDLDEVAVQLNLRPAVVVGLEADNYDQVPVAAYRRGYLRAYARLMGIDETTVVDAYNAQHGRNDLERKLAPVHTTKPPSRVGAWIFKLFTLLVVLGLIGLTLLWWQSREGNDLLGLTDPAAVESVEGEAADNSAADESTTLPPVPEENSDLGLVDDNPPNDGQANGNAANGSGEASMIEPGTAPSTASGETTTPSAPADQTTPPADEAASAESASAEETASAAAAPVDDRSMTLVFSEESWTEIFDANDRRILVGLQPGGSQTTIEGEPPFRLTIGNASGVELSYRGESVDLAAHTGGNNVARFNLGE